MSTKKRPKLPRVGDRVIIPFGGYDLEGDVVDVSETLTPASITVDAWLEGGDEPMRFVYPADRVRPAEPAARATRPGRSSRSGVA